MLISTPPIRVIVRTTHLTVARDVLTMPSRLDDGLVIEATLLE